MKCAYKRVCVCISTDPIPVQLIIQFLEQASKPSMNEQNQVQPPADNRRNRTLKLLALKVAAHMKWDLDVLEKGCVCIKGSLNLNVEEDNVAFSF